MMRFNPLDWKSKAEEHKGLGLKDHEDWGIAVHGNTIGL